jgi:hypothetical protein
MANTANGSHTPSSVQLSYQLLRNTTSPDETRAGVKSFVANLSAFEILKLNTKENLRAYLAEYNPKKRNRVHDAIRMTIQTEPQRFITRNSGFVIGAAAIEVDDNRKTVNLTDPSILNGAQSQGEIRRWVEENFGEEITLFPDEPPFYVRAEIIVDPDNAEVVETAIARNTATPVKSISQAGARGHLEELEESLNKARPGIKIRKKETDEDVYDTRKILQYTRLLMPVSVSGLDSPAERLRPYKNPEQCLTDFSDWYETRQSDAASRSKYNFTVQMAPLALAEYEFWEGHEGWNGHRLWEETKKGGRACRRDKSGQVIWVSPGLVFPIVGAMSEFVHATDSGTWAMNKPKVFEPSDIIAQAVTQFREVNSDPMQMGRDAGVYDALRIYPRTLVKVMKDLEQATVQHV